MTTQLEPDRPGLVWIEKLLPSIIVLSTFGGSITFSVIPSIDDAQPPNQDFTPQNVRTSLALAWLFFFLALATASAGKAILAFQRPSINAGFARKPPQEDNRWTGLVTWMFCRFPLSVFLQVLVLLAFLFSALVVVAYVEVVGWIAVAFTVFFIALAIAVWIMHDCC